MKSQKMILDWVSVRKARCNEIIWKIGYFRFRTARVSRKFIWIGLQYEEQSVRNASGKSTMSGLGHQIGHQLGEQKVKKSCGESMLSGLGQHEFAENGSRLASSMKSKTLGDQMENRPGRRTARIRRKWT